MKREATQSSTAKRQNGNHKNVFTHARDSRKRKVRGLWVRNGRFYLQMRVPGEKSARKIPLKAETLSEAQIEIAEKQRLKRNDQLPAAGLKPLFGDYCERYLSSFSTSAEKRERTIERERTSLVHWRKAFGGVRIDKIKKPMVCEFIEARLKNGTAPRTANIDVVVLRNVLKAAMDAGYLRAPLPVDGLKPKKVLTPKRQMLTPAEFDRLCEAAVQCAKNGVELVDYLKFLAFTGTREQEALRVKWADVDFERKQVVIGADGLSKNGRHREIDFNPSIEAHLRAMNARRAPDCSWLFPSPLRGDRDARLTSFRGAFELARARAGLKWVGFHDLRHLFCSMALMSHVDVKTVATWLGHQDGGLLVLKTYSHLLVEHRQSMAKQLVFTPTVVRAEAVIA